MNIFHNLRLHFGISFWEILAIRCPNPCRVVNSNSFYYQFSITGWIEMFGKGPHHAKTGEFPVSAPWARLTEPETAAEDGRHRYTSKRLGRCMKNLMAGSRQIEEKRYEKSVKREVRTGDIQNWVLHCSPLLPSAESAVGTAANWYTASEQV